MYLPRAGVWFASSPYTGFFKVLCQRHGYARGRMVGATLCIGRQINSRERGSKNGRVDD